jgi:L-fucose isomerase-like protein
MTTTALIAALGRPTFDLTYAGEQLVDARRLLDDLGVRRRELGETITATDQLDDLFGHVDLADVSVIVVLQATFSDASMVIRLAELTDLPMVVWSFPEPRTGGRLRLNSLCGANLAAYSLRRRGCNVHFVHAGPTNDDAPLRVLAALQDIDRPLTVELPAPQREGQGFPAARFAAQRVVDRLDHARIGVIGDAPDGFEPCQYRSDEMHSITGTIADPVELTALFDAADATSATTTASTRARVEAALHVPATVAAQGLDESLRLYNGLRTLAERRHWAAVATRCWPECMTKYGGAACAPQAMLTGDGVPAVCEADAYGALTTLVLREITGTSPFLADLVDIERDDNTSVLWHCGLAALELADPHDAPEATVHPNRGRALLHQFALKPGRVTLARISQVGGELSMVVGGGEMLQRRRPFLGTCGVLRWDRPVNDVLRTVFDHGLEHHLAMAYGDHQDELVALAALWAIPVIRLGGDELGGPG